MSNLLLAHPRPELGIMIQPGMGNDEAPLAHWWHARDNGRFAKPEQWCADKWLAWLERGRQHAHRCLFVTAPDSVGDAEATLALSVPYLPEIRALGYRAAFVAQDGFSKHRPDPDAFDVLFVGGRDEWKFSEQGGYAAARWARDHGKYTHQGRVNSRRRTLTMLVSLFDSVDGTFLARAPDTNFPRLSRWLDEVSCQTYIAVP